MAWVPLWSDSALAPWPDQEPNPLRAQRGWGATELVLLYSGNMGLGHRFGEFLQAACQLGATGPRWVFCGGGKRRAELEAHARAHPAARLDFMDYVAPDSLRAHLCAADVHLASLDSAWAGLIVPSKIQASFAVGRPVLFVGSRQCESAVWILESGGGWCVAENDVPGLLEAIGEALNANERRRRGQAAASFAQRSFQRSVNCERLAQLLEGRAPTA